MSCTDSELIDQVENEKYTIDIYRINGGLTVPLSVSIYVQDKTDRNSTKRRIVRVIHADSAIVNFSTADSIFIEYTSSNIMLGYKSIYDLRDRIDYRKVFAE